MPAAQSPFAATMAHWRSPQLRAAFAIGFCILFAFIGTFTFVNFVLVRPPLALGRMISAWSILSSRLRWSRPVRRQGRGEVRHTAFDLDGAGGSGRRPAADAVLASCGSADRHGAGRRWHLLCAGLRHRLCRAGCARQPRRCQRDVSRCYFFGGLGGSAVLGQLFDRFDWAACVAGVGVALAVAAIPDDPAGSHAVRRISGMISRITSNPVAATPASPRKATLLPNLSLT